MTSADKIFGGVLLVAPVIFGAFLSGAFYLAEGAAVPLTIFQITLMFSFLLFFLKKLIQKDRSFQIYGLEISYLLFLTLIFFSLIYSPERSEGLFQTIRFMVLLAMTYLIYNAINSKEELRTITAVIIVSAVIVALKSLYDTYSNPEVIAFNYLNIGKRIIRSAGDETDPNKFAISFALPFALCLNHLLTAESKRLKALLFTALLIILAAVLVTYSRSTWVALAVSMMITLQYHRKYSIIVYLAVFGIIVLLVSSTARTLFMSILQRMKDIFAGTSDDSSNIRLLLFSGAVQMFLDSWLIGVGFEAFSTRFQTYYTKQETIGVYEPHNEYYRILAELGIIGFLLFAFILYKITKTAFVVIKKTAGILNLMAVSLFGALVSYFIFFIFYADMLYNALFFITVALIFTLRKFVQIDNAEQVLQP